DAQREEWVRLCAINEIKGDLANPGYSAPLTVAFLKSHPTLLVDTRLFDPRITSRLMDALCDITSQTDGILVHSENFHALSLLKNTFSRTISAIYIDPPYNAPASEVLYKNEYKHSSWMTLMRDRLRQASHLLSDRAP